MKNFAFLVTLVALLATSSPLHADAFQCTAGEGLPKVCTATVTLDGVVRNVTIGEGQYFRPTDEESVVTTSGTWVYHS